MMLCARCGGALEIEVEDILGVVLVLRIDDGGDPGRGGLPLRPGSRRGGEEGGGATSTSRSGKVGRGALWFAPTSMYCP